MEDDYKVCRSKRCKRNGIIVATGDRYCTVCGGRLRRSYEPNPILDQPAIIEGDRTAIVTKGGNMTQRTDNHAGNSVVCLDKPPKEKLTYSNFRGNWQAYKAYEKLWEDNKIDDNFYYATKWAVSQLTGIGVEDLKAMDSRPELGNGSDDQMHPTAGDTFTCSTPDVDGCPLFKPLERCLLHIPYSMYNRWVWLCLKFNVEWIAYLKGSQDESTHVWTLSEMYFPKQRANGAHVDAEDNEIQPDTIGAVHSHVGMNAFFSEEDKRHANHPVEIVVNRRGEMETSIRHQLECGRFTRTKSSVLFLADDPLIAVYDTLKRQLTTEGVARVGRVIPLNGTTHGSTRATPTQGSLADSHLGGTE